MQLYERDYSKLFTEEEAEWRSIQQQEIVSKIGSFDIRKSLFHDYPKAVRHSPVDNITLKDGDLGVAFRKGISQVEKWETWIESQYGSLRETFDKYRRSDSILPGEFIALDKSRINYVVVAGKRADFTERTYRLKRKMQKEKSVLILHYDNLIDDAQYVIGKMTY